MSPKALIKNEEDVWYYTVPYTVNVGGTEISLRNATDGGINFKFVPIINEKAVKVGASDMTNGKIDLSAELADAGKKYTFILTPNDGYKVKKGSVSVTLTAGGKTVDLKATGRGRNIP